MEKKGKRIESDNGEIPLPEVMIQHIQSFLSGKEAARTTILSKSWYAAWLTRPVLDFDYGDFPRESWPVFEEYVKTTMQRYQGLSLKIENFRLCVSRLSVDRLRWDRGCSWAHDLIVNAINIGATDVDLDFPFDTTFTLPKEVLRSQTLHRLSVSGGIVDRNLARCSRLQSLSLSFLKIASDDIKDIISCCVLITELSLSCCVLITELSLSYCCGLTLSLANLYELHKLRRLYLCSVDVDDTFFTDFASRFPCLKDLAILGYDGHTRIVIASSSLQTIHLTTRGSRRAKFDVPNIRKFTYSGYGLPSQLSIKGGTTEWELDISIECKRFHKNSWFLNLKKLLTKFKLSRISLYLNLDYECKDAGRSEHDLDIEVVPKPLVLENLMIGGPSSLHLALLLCLFGICRPKFLNVLFYSWSDANASFAILYKRLMKKSVTPNSGIPDQDMFGKFGLKKVNMEVYKRFDEKRQPLMLEKPLDPSKTPEHNQEIEFELIWD